MEIYKKYQTFRERFERVTLNVVEGFIPFVAHKVSTALFIPPVIERIGGYATAVGTSTAAMMVGFFGAVVAPFVAMTAVVLGAPVVAGVVALAIPVGVIAGSMGMVMSQSRALDDGYFGYVDMQKKMFKDEARPDTRFGASLFHKLKGSFKRAAVKADPLADPQPQNHLLPAPAAQPRP